MSVFLSICVCLPKDLANRWTDVALLYRKASYSFKHIEYNIETYKRALLGNWPQCQKYLAVRATGNFIEMPWTSNRHKIKVIPPILKHIFIIRKLEISWIVQPQLWDAVKNGRAARSVGWQLWKRSSLPRRPEGGLKRLKPWPGILSVLTATLLYMY